MSETRSPYLPEDQAIGYEAAWFSTVRAMRHDKPGHCDLCDQWSDPLTDGLCPHCLSAYHPRTLGADPEARRQVCDPDERVPMVAASTMAQAAQLHFILYGSLSTDVRLSDIAVILTEFLFQVRGALLRGKTVPLEYVGALTQHAAVEVPHEH